MNDLISRQATIDIVSGYAERFDKYIGSPNDSEVYAYVRGLILSIERNINAVPSAQPEPQWIPCSERLPEIGDYVICAQVNGDVGEGKLLPDGSWLILYESAEYGTHWVTAWMPLPSHIKKGGKNENW